MKKDILSGLCATICALSLLFTGCVRLQGVDNNESMPNSTKSDKVKDKALRELKSDIVALAEKYFDLYYKKLSLEEKNYIDEGKSKLTSSIDMFSSSRELSAAAVIFSATASSQYLPIVLSAAAVLANPEDAIIVNNFGTTLKEFQQIDDSIKVLLYARNMEGNSPMILTNLGNSYLDKHQTDQAKECFLKALEIDYQFGPAYEGMAVVYIQKNEGQKAVGEIIKSAQLGYSPFLRAAYRAAKGKGGVVDIPPWDKLLNNDSANEDSNDNSEEPNQPQNDKLIMPLLPKWESRGAFLATLPNLEPLIDKTMEIGFIGAFTFAAKYHPEDLEGGYSDFDDDYDYEDDYNYEGEYDYEDEYDYEGEYDFEGEYDGNDGVDLGAIEKIELLPSYGQKLFMLELVNDYYANKIEQVYNKTQAKRQQIDKQFEKDLESIRESENFKKMEKKILQNDIGGAKALAKEINKLSGQMADTHFYAWRDLALANYNGIKDLMYEYWKISDQVTGSIYNQDVLDYVNQIREITVYVSIMPVITDFSLLPTTYALVDIIAPIVTPDEDLSQYKAEIINPMEIPKKEKKECAIKGKKLSVSLGPASFGVTCDTWELEVLEGIGGAIKRNFKTGETEITVLVGAKAGAAGSEISGKIGATVKFDGKGNYSGWGTTSGAGAKVGMGPLEVSGGVDFGSIGSANSTVSIGSVGVGTNND